MKIGILIPSTSHGRPWTSYKETYLFNLTLKTFLITYDKEHSYNFYIGIDRGDKILDNENDIAQIKRFISIMKNVEIEFMYMDNIPKGHLTIMWNRLFQKAYDDNCEYFFQCGDDIDFKTLGWVNACIETLQKANNVGMVGPVNNNNFILTQSFVSRKHMELFGYYFPEEIINWYCDDWINGVYKGINRLFVLQNHMCGNMGGPPRYEINNDPTFVLNFSENRRIYQDRCTEIVKRDLVKIVPKLL